MREITVTRRPGGFGRDAVDIRVGLGFLVTLTLQEAATLRKLMTQLGGLLSETRREPAGALEARVRRATDMGASFNDIALAERIAPSLVSWIWAVGQAVTPLSARTPSHLQLLRSWGGKTIAEIISLFGARGVLASWDYVEQLMRRERVPHASARRGPRRPGEVPVTGRRPRIVAALESG